MERLKRNKYNKAFKIYTKFCENKFPLISSVLKGKQSGDIFVDKCDKPKSFFIINKFGFSYYFTLNEDKEFQDNLLNYLIEERQFPAEKIRLYYPPKKLYNKLKKNVDGNIFGESIRVQFILDKKEFSNKNIMIEKNFQIKKINDKVFDRLSILGLHLDQRFFDSKNDFLQKSVGFAAFYKDEPVSICYSASSIDCHAEIDIYTSREFRGKNLAKSVAISFICYCLEKNIQPSWDCYSNNIPSYNLGLELGFKENIKYPFFIIKKRNKDK